MCVCVFQLAQLQAELEEEWKGKCEQALASAKEQQGREMAELAEQRDTLEQRLTQLQEKVNSLTHIIPYTKLSLSRRHFGRLSSYIDLCVAKGDLLLLFYNNGTT